MLMFCSIYYCNPSLRPIHYKVMVWRVVMTRHYVTEKHILSRPAQYDRLTVQRKTYKSPLSLSLSLSLSARHDMWYFLQCLRDILETSNILEFDIQPYQLKWANWAIMRQSVPLGKCIGNVVHEQNPMKMISLTMFRMLELYFKKPQRVFYRTN